MRRARLSSAAAAPLWLEQKWDEVAAREEDEWREWREALEAAGRLP